MENPWNETIFFKLCNKFYDMKFHERWICSVMNVESVLDMSWVNKFRLFVIRLKWVVPHIHWWKLESELSTNDEWRWWRLIISENVTHNFEHFRVFALSTTRKKVNFSHNSNVDRWILDSMHLKNEEQFEFHEYLTKHTPCVHIEDLQIRRQNEFHGWEEWKFLHLFCSQHSICHQESFIPMCAQHERRKRTWKCNEISFRD